MARFTREELESFRGKSVADLLPADPKLLIVGINPGLMTAATNTHFCHPSNRFYPALRLAGLISWSLDADLGMTPEQRADLLGMGIGITNLVNRATAKASELAASELQSGALRLAPLAERWRPAVVAVAGVSAYRVAFRRPGAALGVQPGIVGPAALWVIPNPSGLNAHVTVSGMADWLRRVADAAAISRGSGSIEEQRL